MTAAPTGAATVVSRTQSGGVLQLDGDRATAMEQAVEQMIAHCGHSYAITQEGEEAVGTDTVTGAGQPSTTRTVTAWRMHYTCS